MVIFFSYMTSFRDRLWLTLVVLIVLTKNAAYTLQWNFGILLFYKSTLLKKEHFNYEIVIQDR